jgi:hypothetical protein
MPPNRQDIVVCGAARREEMPAPASEVAHPLAPVVRTERMQALSGRYLLMADDTAAFPLEFEDGLPLHHVLLDRFVVNRQSMYAPWLAVGLPFFFHSSSSSIIITIILYRIAAGYYHGVCSRRVHIRTLFALEIRHNRQATPQGLADRRAPLLPRGVDIRGEEMQPQRPAREAGHAQEQVEVGEGRDQTLWGSPRVSVAFRLRRDGEPRRGRDMH